MFELLKTDPFTKARLGRLTTKHGVVDTPVFMSVGTQGSVKAIDPRELNEMGTQIILGNTYHLNIRPGMEILENDAYERLCRVYVGELTPGEALPLNPDDTLAILTTNYALSVLDDLNARPDQARARRAQLLASPFWPAFAVIAAEADQARATR